MRSVLLNKDRADDEEPLSMKIQGKIDLPRELKWMRDFVKYVGNTPFLPCHVSNRQGARFFRKQLN